MLKFKVWKSKDGWRWNAKHKGRIVAESGEGYARKAGCHKTLYNILKAIVDGKYSVAK